MAVDAIGKNYENNRYFVKPEITKPETFSEETICKQLTYKFTQRSDVIAIIIIQSI